MEQDLTLHALFAFLFTRSVYHDDLFWWIWRTILYHCYLSPWLVYHLLSSLFWSGRFLILLRNVFSRTETRPVREKQIGQRDYTTSNVDRNSDCNVVTKSCWKYKYSASKYREWFTAWKVSKYEVISGPYFRVFGPEITLYLDIFHAMIHKIYSLSV